MVYANSSVFSYVYPWEDFAKSRDQNWPANSISVVQKSLETVLVVRACKAEPSVNSFTHWVFAESIMFAHILG